MQQVFCFPVYTDEIDPEYVKSKNSEKVQFVMPVFEDETADSLSKELKKPKYISRNYVDWSYTGTATSTRRRVLRVIQSALPMYTRTSSPLPKM